MQECADLCDHLPGCLGFSISNTTEGLCFPTDTVSRSTSAFTPILSYARVSQHPSALAATATHGEGACLSVLRALCPSSLSRSTCRLCTGKSQRQERAAGCSADDVARYCDAMGLVWWVAAPTAHVFEDDLPTMSQYCQPSSALAVRQVQWSAVAGGTVASQLALRWLSTHVWERMLPAQPVVFDLSDLTAIGGRAATGAAAVVPALSMSVRQVGSVFAPNAEYLSERGPAFYPDILAPIYHNPTVQQHDGANLSAFEFLYDGKRNGSNGHRLSWESGGRQISNERVPGGGGPAGVSQCQRICDSQPTCNGIFLGAAGDCHTVNATNVAVATSLEGVSYRRKRIGMPLVPNITRSVWLDVTVPANTTPGLYTGSITVQQPGRTAAADLFSVPITLRVWPVSAECLQTQLRLYGKGYGFDPTIVGQLYQGLDASGHGSVPKSILDFTKFMCDRHVPAEALANSWATQRPLSDITMLLSDQCQQVRKTPSWPSSWANFSLS